MPAQDETILFSAIAVLLAALALGGLADFASVDANARASARELRVSANTREVHAAGAITCAPAAAAPAEQRG